MWLNPAKHKKIARSLLLETTLCHLKKLLFVNFKVKPSTQTIKDHVAWTRELRTWSWNGNMLIFNILCFRAFFILFWYLFYLISFLLNWSHKWSNVALCNTTRGPNQQKRILMARFFFFFFLNIARLGYVHKHPHTNINY